MGDNLSALTTLFTEFYYWVTIVFMFLIHVGFCVYEVGVSRRRNHLHTLMKNTMLIPVVTVTFFFFGWWIYFGLPNGPGITGGILFDAGTPNTPWSPTMAPNLGDHITGVFWGAFLLFSLTAASIVSGAVIERVRTGAFLVIAVLIGSVTWILDAAWGWSYNGWMVKVLGYHDAYASGVVHAIAGGTALGVLIVLGPRLGHFTSDGKPRDFVPQNPWLVTVGLFLIYTGFWGFYAACNIPIISPETIGGQITGATWTATTIYLTPTTLGGITFNFLMSLSGGMMAAYLISKGDPFWTYSGGLAGIIAASAGNDLYHPIQAMFIGGVGPSSPTRCTTGSRGGSRSTTQWAPWRCMATAASSAWSSPASCSGAIRPRRTKATRRSIRSGRSSARLSCSSSSASSRDGSRRRSSTLSDCSACRGRSSSWASISRACTSRKQHAPTSETPRRRLLSALLKEDRNGQLLGSRSRQH